MRQDDKGNSDLLSQVFNLKQSLVRHKKSVRSLAANSKGLLVSASFDNTVAFWVKVEDKFEFLKDTFYHEDSVYVVRATVAEDGFFTGGKDRKIMLMDNEGNPLHSYEGHTMTVNSVSQRESNCFISGSWDGSARVWDVSTGKVINTLTNHSHAVTTLALPGGRYVTGSQDKKLRFWDKGTCYKTIENAHSDIIRDIKISPDDEYIYTCSNDYTVKKWTLGGDEIEMYHGHEGFVFSILVNNNFVFSAGDDGIVNIWKGQEKNGSCLHPNTIWDMCFSGADDLVTACGDGVIRVFSKDATKWQTPQEIEDYNSYCMSQMNKDGNSGNNQTINLADCPDVRLINEYQGQDGEVKVFNNNGTPEAYIYRALAKTWELVSRNLGDSRTSSSGKKFYYGDQYFEEGEYDYVFDVELEGSKFLLPFNKGGNALVAAEKFCGRENLHRGYIDEIRNFLRQNTQDNQTGKPQPKPEQKKPAQTSSKPGSSQPSVSFSGSFKFPKIAYTTFDKINVDVPFQKVMEFSEKLAKDDSTKALALSNLDCNNIKRFAEVIKNTQFYHNSVIDEYDYNLLVNKIKTWPNEFLIPILDFFRMFFLHPRSHDFFKKTGAGLTELTAILERYRDGTDNMRVLVLRILNNFFCNEYPRVFISGKREMVLEGVSTFLDSENKNIRAGLASLLYNFSIAYYDKEDKEASIQIISLLNEMIMAEKEAPILLDLLTALGNMIFKNKMNVSISQDMDLSSTIESCDTEGGDDYDLNDINALKVYLKTLLK